MTQPLLTIAIPTIESRKVQFEALVATIRQQIELNDAESLVEIISECDNKEISIGKKRDNLIRKANGTYLVMIDDDDTISRYYIQDVLEACTYDADCIGYFEQIHHARKMSVITLRATEWTSEPGNGGDLQRTPFFKVPIKTDICKQVGCADMRFAEDEDFAKRIYPLLKTEHFIPKIMYHYRYRYENHNDKYGIKA